MPCLVRGHDVKATAGGFVVLAHDGHGIGNSRNDSASTGTKDNNLSLGIPHRDESLRGPMWRTKGQSILFQEY